MKKILIVSDIHLKLRSSSSAWEASRFLQLFKELAAQSPDILILNGDIFDRSRPTLEEQALLNQALLQLSLNTKVYILDGNHEAVSLNKSSFDYLYLVRNTEYVTEKVVLIEGISLALVSWQRKHNVYKYNADVLVSHFRSSMPPFITEELRTEAFDDNFKMQILGDIHDRYFPKPRVMYTGTPYTINFVKAPKNQGYVELTVEGTNFSARHIDTQLPNKIKLELNVSEYAQYKWDSTHFYHVVLTGSIDELHMIKPLHDNVVLTKVVDELEYTQEVVPLVSFVETLVSKVSAKLSYKNMDTKIKSIIKYHYEGD